MENISNVLFWISNGLLVPVIVGLLYFFIRALFLLGGVYGEYLERNKTERDLNSWKIWLKRRCMDFGRIWGKCNRLLLSLPPGSCWLTG